MKIATWNVNSVRARLANIIEWLQQASPDVVLLQEIKCETPLFPSLDFAALGYKSHALGQKSYNGVAILSRHDIENIVEGLPGDDEDPQARYLEATVGGVRLASIYLPNGNPVESEKYTYKLDWMRRLKNRADELLKDEKPVVLGGDFNIIPAAVDVHNPQDWLNDALFMPQSRAAFREIIQLGYTEIFRALHSNQNDAYTYWDYTGGAWPQDKGIRIDHFLLSPEAADKAQSCIIDRAPRDREKASDHTPVILELAN